MLNFIGFILPPFIDLINRKVKDSDLRFWISVLVCTIFGVAINFIRSNGFEAYGGMTFLEVFESMSGSALEMFGLAQLSYKAVWEGSDMRSDLNLDATKLK